jgi:hypothetical protein
VHLFELVFGHFDVLERMSVLACEPALEPK